MDKSYDKIVFVNGQSPDLDADNMNAISTGLDTVDSRVVAIDSRLGEDEEQISQNTTDIASKLDANNGTATGTLVAGVIKAESLKYVEEVKVYPPQYNKPSEYIYADVKTKIEGMEDDIAELKNVTPGIPLTSTSPLLTSTSATINGMDALGESKQDGTPTPTNPISIVDASGDVTCRTEDNTQSNTITLPTLRSVGDVKDELIVSKDGGTIVRRVGKTTLNVTLIAGTSKTMALSGISSAYGRLSIISDCFPCAYSGDNYICVNSAYSGLVMQSATAYSGDVVVYYPLATPTETTLTTSEVASILALKTYDGTTIVDSELDVTIDYVGNTKGYIDTKTDYSYTDTVIGTWADGKPLHRMVIDVKSPSSINADGVVSNVINTSTISLKDIRGVVHASNTDISINSQIVSGYFTSAWIDSHGLKMLVSNNSYANKPCEIIVEYTINDESAISVLSEGE